ncbi:hypothetical protein LIT32_12370 [Bacillus sp. CMF21]|nr:hypothetical protein LIT32_12370 [Bacillus sp. CMF21]
MAANIISPWSKETEKYGNMVTVTQLGKLIHVNRDVLHRCVELGIIDKYVMWVEKDIEKPPFPFHNARYVIRESDAEIIKEELEKIKNASKNKEIIADYFFAKILDIPLEDLTPELINGKWSDCIELIRPSFNAKDLRPMYFLNKKKAISKLEYLPLRQVANLIDEPWANLQNYAKKGYLKPSKVECDRHLWKVEDVVQQLPSIKAAAWERVIAYKGDEKMIPWNRLSDEQKLSIENYLDDRKKSKPIIWEDRKHYHKGFIKPEKEAEKQRQTLAQFFVKVIDGRSIRRGLFDNTQLDMELYDISKEDIRHFEKGYQPTTLFKKKQVIIPFLYWLLMQVEEQYPLHRINQNQSEKYLLSRSKLLSAINQFSSVEPIVESRGKVYLTRKEILMIYRAILTEFPKFGTKEHLKYATMWMCGAFAGIRPEEISELRIKHFILDDNGLLKAVNGKGYGILKLPASASKGMYSPSHPKLGTLIVPTLRIQINCYLKELYKIQVPGEGYLFRPFHLKKHVETKQGAAPTFKWVRVYKHLFDFLTSNQINDFQFKNSRHSMNNLFDKTGLHSDLETVKDRAAQVHMRHNIKMKSGSVRETSYTDEISPIHYFKVIDEVLNFPWDIGALEEWENQKGYNTVSSFDTEDASLLYNFNEEDFGINNESIEDVSSSLLADLKKEKKSKELSAEENKQELQKLNEQLNLYRKSTAKKLNVSALDKAKKTKELTDKIQWLKSIIPE